MTSKVRRERGMLFIADDADWVEMKRARKLTQALNTIDRADFAGILALVRELFGRADETTFLNPPFYCDYGSNIFVGRNSVIGAGSVVTRDIPDWSFAAGNPCRVIRAITEADRPMYARGREIDEEIMNQLEDASK